MPVSKKRYPKKGKKRTKRIKPDIVGGHTAHFNLGGLEISDDIISAFHDDGIKYYDSVLTRAAELQRAKMEREVVISDK